MATPSTQPNGSALFAPFPRFPTELQHAVWKELLPEPILHEVRFEEGVELPRSANDGDCGIPCTAAHPILLRICKGSRDFALLHYTNMFDRKAIIQPVGQWLNGVPSNNIVTADTPGVKDYFEHRFSFSLEPEKITGLKHIFRKRSYVDLGRDTIYFNLYTFATNLEERGLRPSLRFLNWHINLDDSQKIKRMTIDFAIWKSPNEIDGHSREPYVDEYYGGKKLNDTHLRLWLLFKRGAFANLETLTLVWYDHGDKRLLERYEHKHRGPVTFVEHAEIGPEKRRKNGNRLGPWYQIGWQTDCIRGWQPSDMKTVEDVKDSIEAVKAELVADIAEIREKMPEIKIPDIQWAYALRNGKFRTY